MNTPDELYEMERQFWTGGAEFYEQHLAPAALMVFPSPVGVLDRKAAISGIRSGARWSNVDMTECTAAQLGADTAALAYRVVARRGEGGAPYTALVGSVYIRTPGGWSLAFHQHTPSPAV